DGHFDDCGVGRLAEVRARLQIPYIDFLIRYRGSELVEQAGPVIGMNHDADRERLFRIARPFHINPALGIVHQVLHIRTRSRMDGDALAAGHVTDDGVPANGVAAFGAIDHQVLDTADPDRIIVGFFLAARRGWLRGDVRRRRRFFRHQLRHCLLQYLAGRELSVAQCGEQIFGLVEPVIVRYALEILAAYGSHSGAEPPRFFFEILLADFDSALPLARIDEVLDAVARARGLDDRQPVFARLMSGRGQDVDNVAVAQRVFELDDPPVDARARACIADFGVNRIREIDGRGTSRQRHHAALRGEAVDFLGVKIETQGGIEIAGIPHILLPLDELPEPGNALIVLNAAFAFFVLPVRRDAFFGNAVHFLGADLDLEVPPLRPDHGRVQRLIEIGTRNGDEVLDAAGHGPPLVMDYAQRAVAVLHRIRNDAKAEKIVDLIERDLLALQLLIDGVSPFDAGLHPRRNALAAQR